MSSSRLVTWNLFFSASSYERDEPITWEVIEDLSALIDLLSLYPAIQVLGDTKHLPFLTHQTDFFDAMRSSNAIDVRSTTSVVRQSLAQLTSRHLRMFLPRVEDAKLDRWVNDALSLNEMPSARERVATMNAQARLYGSPALSSPTPDTVSAALNTQGDPLALRPFVIRTFMYVSYAELGELPFAPDSTRSSLVGAAIGRENDLATQLRSKVAEQWERFPTIGNIDLRRRVSPFAAVILERCRGDRRAIPGEILALRDELRDIRQFLGELEHGILFGTRQEAVESEKKWNGVLEEVVRSFGPSPKLVEITSGLALAQGAADVLDNSTRISTWARVAALPADIVVRYLRRRPVAQLHRLRSELPASGRLSAVVRSMFPEIERSKAPLAALYPVRRPE